MVCRLVVTVGLICCVVTASMAQSDPIKDRKDIMKGFGEPFYGALNRMQRGQLPYDQKAVDDGFHYVTQNAPKLHALFPDSTKNVPSTDDYGPTAKVWENKPDFDARIDQLAKDATDNLPAAKDVDGLKAAFAAVRKTCDDCHEIYRVKLTK